MLEQRLEQGERLIKDIESVFDEMDESPGRKKNIAAEGLINDPASTCRRSSRDPRWMPC